MAKISREFERLGLKKTGLSSNIKYLLKTEKIGLQLNGSIIVHKLTMTLISRTWMEDQDLADVDVNDDDDYEDLDEEVVRS
jgi:hypothetical protein